MTARIITTIGPSSSKTEILEALRDSNLVDTFRLNLSHLNFESLTKQVAHFKKHNINPALDNSRGSAKSVTQLRGKIQG